MRDLTRGTIGWFSAVATSCQPRDERRDESSVRHTPARYAAQSSISRRRRPNRSERA